ncbi:hypothetical protein JG688_00017866 [Phytophthora aleatoria]|uniref:Uncharacterized protein n=1 Tax=Phytophthora aleatoria TaxID=2496075 RepID=A0A8J5I9Q6_9STRA|nr:hypothetical protein JG688_00017866 [Phytophthora aleatoria]
MQDEDAYVVVHTKETLWCVKLTQPSALLKVDPLNNALQPVTGVSSTALNVHEILLLQNRLVTTGLESAKNDLFGRGSWRTMHQTADPVLCPVLALRHIMEARRELRQQSSTYLMVDLPAGEMAKELKDTA